MLAMRICAASVVWALSSFPVYAAEVPGEFQIYEENDVFYYLNSKSNRTDRWYTQGLRFERMYPSAPSPKFVADIPGDFWCKWLCGANYSSGLTNVGWSLGQNIYTPQVITKPEEQPNDRPWAGYLYFGRIAQQTYAIPQWGMERQDRLEVDFGFVGPIALGEEAQNTLHRHILHIPGGAGWSHQLRDEPTILIRNDIRLRFPECATSFDVLPYARSYLGNVLIAAELGTTVRAGWNLKGFARDTIPSFRFAQLDESSSSPSGCDKPSESDDFLSSASIFARASGRAVAHNIFLDGNTFDISPNVEKRFFVYEYAIGVDAMLAHFWGCPMGVSIQFVNRGPEFVSPDIEGRIQRFGSIQLHWEIN